MVGTSLIVDWQQRAKTAVDNAIPRQVDLGYIRKLRKPGVSLHGFYFISRLGCLCCWTVIYNPKQINKNKQTLLISRSAFGHCVITATETQTKIKILLFHIKTTRTFSHGRLQVDLKTNTWLVPDFSQTNCKPALNYVICLCLICHMGMNYKDLTCDCF